MSCENNPNILTNNCQLREDCSNVTVDHRTLDSNGCVIRKARRCPKVIKVPKFLATVKLETCLIDDVRIPEGFSEIKTVSKKVIINQCKIVYDHLMVEGYILKNISYVTPDPITTDTNTCIAYRNTWRDIDVKVPFSIGTRVHLPHLNKGCRFSQEVPFKFNSMKGNCCDRGVMGESLCETLRKDFVCFAEEPYCDLRSYHIVELDINSKPCMDMDETNLFGVFTEKLSLYLKIDILVDDYVEIKKGWCMPHTAPGGRPVAVPEQLEIEEQVDGMEYEDDVEDLEETDAVEDIEIDLFDRSFNKL